MRRLGIVAAWLWLVLIASQAGAVAINTGETLRVDFSLNRTFPGPFDVVFFSPVFGQDILGPFESLTFGFYDSSDQLLVERVFDLDNVQFPSFGTGAVFIQTTLDSTGHVLLTQGSGSVNLVELTLNFASLQGGGLTSPLTLTFPIPEPGSAGLLMAGLASAVLLLRKRRPRIRA
jgi:hypothetical protein